MTISKDLREAVLQAAMQGKLTEQLPTDSPVDTFLSSIQLSKAEMRKEKRLSKEKELLPISDDDIPFDIPESWRWERVGNIFTQSSGKAMNASKALQGDEYEFITTSNLYWNRFDLSSLKKMRFTENEIEKCTAKKGDLLICEGGDIGRAAIWDYDYDIKLQNHIHRLRACVPTNMMFFYYLFYFYKNANLISGKGIAIQGLSANALRSIVFPIPPIEEQQRIVDKVEELMTKIDELEKTEQALESIKSKFPGEMKAAILSAALQGKLSERSECDFPIDETIRRLGLEQAHLIKAKEIKKDSIIELDIDTTPFDIPDEWRWAPLSALCSKEIKRGKSPTYVANSNTLVFAQKCNTKYNGIDMKLSLCLDETTLKKYSDSDFLQPDDIVINSTGTGTLGRIGYITAEDFIDTREVVADSHVTLVRVLSPVNPRYIYACLMYYQPYLEGNGEGSTNQKELKPSTIKNLYIPVPPIEEQQRIVEKLDKLLPLCERLKER